MSAPYIRPCAAFPDGMFIPEGIVDRLIVVGLIERDYWSENASENDYAAVYDEDDMDTVAYDIQQHVRKWIAPGAHSL